MAQSAGARSGQALHQQDFADMVSLVALAHTHTKLTFTTLRDGLDKLYPGQFLPPREKGNFVVEGPVPEFQFAIQCTIPGAAQDLERAIPAKLARATATRPDNAFVACGPQQDDVTPHFGTKIPLSSAHRHMPASPACGYCVSAIASTTRRAASGATASVALAAFSRTCMLG